MQQTQTGAIREKLTAGSLRFDLLLGNGEVLLGLAQTFAEGAAKGYAPDNWKKGFSSTELINHTMEHLIKHFEGDKSEDHINHAIWNLGALKWQYKHRPELIEYPLCDVANSNGYEPVNTEESQPSPSSAQSERLELLNDIASIINNLPMEELHGWRMKLRQFNT